MQHSWIFITGLILAIVVTGCITTPTPSPGITPTTQIVTTSQSVPGTIAKTGNTVSVFYTGTLDDGTLFDTNVNATPLTFTLGQGMVIPGFEAAVLGMRINEPKTVFIPFEKAYGSYNPSLIFTVNRSVRNDYIPVVGEYITVRRNSDGALIQAKIINVTASTITYDENNALAGKNLTFSIRLVGVK
jgi:peptidylprolyl isomerase